MFLLSVFGLLSVIEDGVSEKSILRRGVLGLEGLDGGCPDRVRVCDAEEARSRAFEVDAESLEFGDGIEE
jgi:hypothetical protein